MSDRPVLGAVCVCMLRGGKGKELRRIWIEHNKDCEKLDTAVSTGSCKAVHFLKACAGRRCFGLRKGRVDSEMSSETSDNLQYVISSSLKYANILELISLHFKIFHNRQETR